MALRDTVRLLRGTASTGCAVLLVGAVGLTGALAGCGGNDAARAAPQLPASALPTSVSTPSSAVSSASPSPSAKPSATAKPKARKPGVPLSRSRVEPAAHPSAKVSPPPVPLLPPAVPLQAIAPPANVFGPDFPDPEVVYDAVRSEYFAFGTNTVGENVQRLVSRDGVRWRRLPDALPALPADAVGGGTWAPNVRFNTTSGKWVMTFAYLSHRTGREQLGVATAPAPDATFSPQPGVVRALADGHVIDPDSVIVGGIPYLVSVEARSSGNRFVAQQQTADGLGVVGEPFVLASAPYVLEGPTLVVVGDTVICVFASGRTGVWNQPGYSTWYVEDSVERVFGQHRRLALGQARPLMVTWPGSAVATGEPATALDPLTGNLASTSGTLTFYTNDLHKESFFGAEYDARYLMAYPVRIGDGGQRPGGPIALWSPPPTASPKPKPKPKPTVKPRPTPTPLPRPTFVPTTRAPSPTPKPTPTRPTGRPTPTPVHTGSPVPSTRTATPHPTRSPSPAAAGPGSDQRTAAPSSSPHAP